jgi:sarcosine oxidase subunit beta
MTRLKTEKADLIVIGGGIFGCAIAYYYSRNNPSKKIILLERNELCNAATSRAAALMTRVRSKKNFIPLSLETYRVIPELENQLHEDLRMKQVGVLHVAASEARVRDLVKLMSLAESFQLPHEYVGPAQALSKCPWLNVDETMQIGYMPGEGYCDPYLLGSFFARCAKMQGAEIRQSTEVTELLLSGKAVLGVRTQNETIQAGTVILASGVWAPVLADQAGIGLPMAPVRSQYWITEKAALFPEDSPMVILPDAHAYARPEGGRLLFGIREKKSMAVSPKDLPSNLSHFAFSPDRGIQDLSESMQRLVRFFPKLSDTGLAYYIAGFSGYAPDNNLSMGIAPGIEGLLLATGCCGAGISVSGGVGLAFAELAAGRPNPFDFSAFDIDRFGKIDPFSEAWLADCASARSGKLSG